MVVATLLVFFYLGLVSFFFLMMVIGIDLCVIWVGLSHKKLHMAMIILGMIVSIKLDVSCGIGLE